jgi:hypothetical protein
MNRSKVDQDLARAQDAHENDPARAAIIAATRRFKSSWIELAEALVEVRRESNWKAWGFSSFDDYTRLELRLKRETVEKLTGSYAFLQRRAPRVLERDGLEESIPSYQSVDFLRRAEEQDDAPAEALEGIRQKVLEESAPLPSIAKQYSAQVFPIDEAEKKRRDAAAIKNVANRLRELLTDSRVVTKKLSGEIIPLLDEVLEAVAKSAERAA